MKKFTYKFKVFNYFLQEGFILDIQGEYNLEKLRKLESIKSKLATKPNSISLDISKVKSIHLFLYNDVSRT